MNPVNIIEKYYKKDTPLYDILLLHSESVCSKALDIVKQNPLLQIDANFVREAALLHDIGIFQTDAPGIHCTGTYPYIAHGYLGAELLRKEGFPRHALVCERHTGTGIPLEQIISKNMPIPHRDMMPESIEEQLICFSDKFFSKTHLDGELPLQKVRCKMEKIGSSSLKRFDEWYQFFYHRIPVLL